MPLSEHPGTPPMIHRINQVFGGRRAVVSNGPDGGFTRARTSEGVYSEYCS
jgi:hypothetical protein